MRHFKYNSNSELIENNIYQEYNYNSPRLIKINSKIGSNEIIKKGNFYMHQMHIQMDVTRIHIIISYNFYQRQE